MATQERYGISKNLTRAEYITALIDEQILGTVVDQFAEHAQDMGQQLEADDVEASFSFDDEVVRDMAAELVKRLRDRFGVRL